MPDLPLGLTELFVNLRSPPTPCVQSLHAGRERAIGSQPKSIGADYRFSSVRKGVTALPDSYAAIKEAGWRNFWKSSQAFDALMDRNVSMA